tara:strand:- start:9562 stop:9759 length:198 start_codon:yes stop_codon:yes gene_type:complete
MKKVLFNIQHPISITECPSENLDIGYSVLAIEYSTHLQTIGMLALENFLISGRDQAEINVAGSEY